MNRAAERSGRKQGNEFPVGLNSGQRENTREMGHRLRKRSEFPVRSNLTERENLRKIADRPRKRRLFVSGPLPVFLTHEMVPGCDSVVGGRAGAPVRAVGLCHVRAAGG